MRILKRKGSPRETIASMWPASQKKLTNRENFRLKLELHVLVSDHNGHPSGEEDGSASGLVQTRPVAEDPAIGPNQCCYAHTDARPQEREEQVLMLVITPNCSSFLYSFRFKLERKYS